MRGRRRQLVDAFWSLCRSFAPLLVVTVLTGPVSALEFAGPVWGERNRPAPTPPEGRSLPGRGEPSRSAEPVAYKVAWDDYITWIVVTGNGGLRSRAWVSTHNKSDGTLAVSYCGSAFRDDSGDVHIDCQRVRIHGPLAASWSPDSFAVHPDGSVRVIDDKNRGNVGTATETIPGHGESDDTMRQRYQALLHYVAGMVNGHW